MELRKVNICKCSCHQVGTKCMHMMACCHLCYEQYLDENNKVIPEKYNKIVDRVKEENKDQLNERQYNYFIRNNYFTHYEDLKDF